MAPIHTILLPTDFGPLSEAAFKYACTVARVTAAEVVLLHVVEPAFVAEVEGVPTPFPTGLLEVAEKRLKNVVLPDSTTKCRHEVRAGSPVEEIARLADEFAADLIVMGTHGRHGLSRLLLGSVAEGVLRRVACPVLFVKEHKKPVEAAA
ncbi:universal stress protein [Limnoglobus roseus]|uniref:universal stress protein n=1 Tax=Limnoglobus roseus TaxID=2598579 RepID=UPI00143D853E|nr:universal stress protein [Limnoglobus roseus]